MATVRVCIMDRAVEIQDPCPGIATWREWTEGVRRALAYTDRLAALLPPCDRVELVHVTVLGIFPCHKMSTAVPVLTRGNAVHRARVVRGQVDVFEEETVPLEAGLYRASHGECWGHVLATPTDDDMLWVNTLDSRIHWTMDHPRWHGRRSALQTIHAGLRRWRAGLHARLLAFLCVARRLGFSGILVRDLLAPHVLHDLADVDARLAAVGAEIGIQ